MNSAPYFGSRSVTNNRTVDRQVALASGNHETDLLRHFRYHVGPWIDTGDPELPFGLQVLLLSRTNRALQAAVLALAAGQRLVVTTPNSKDLESTQKFRKEAEESLTLEYDLTRYAGHALLMLQDALPTGPQQWRSLLVDRIEHISDFASRAVGEEVGDALLWLYFRLGKAGSNIPNKLASKLTRHPLQISQAQYPLQNHHLCPFDHYSDEMAPYYTTNNPCGLRPSIPCTSTYCVFWDTA